MSENTSEQEAGLRQLEVRVLELHPCDSVAVEIYTSAEELDHALAAEAMTAASTPPTPLRGGENYAAAKMALDVFDRRMRGGSGS